MVTQVRYTRDGLERNVFQERSVPDAQDVFWEHAPFTLPLEEQLW